MIYLDQAATSFIKPPQVASAVIQAMQECASLGRSGHQPAMNAAAVAYHARMTAAKLFDSEPEQVVFTHNATHGLNVAIRSLVESGDKVVISGFEHNAVLRTLYACGAEILTANGRLFDTEEWIEAFKNLIRPDIKAVICNHVSNVFGNILPVEEIASHCREYGIPFILDASQSAGVLPISLKKLHAAFIAAPGHKSLYGPQGTGVLICGKKPKPLLFGGTGSNSIDLNMPDEIPDLAEAGTHNIPGIAGLDQGMQYVLDKGVDALFAHEHGLMLDFVRKIQIPGGIICFSDHGINQTGVVSCIMPEMDCEYAAYRLSEMGIAVRAGLHCAPLAHQSVGTLNTGTIRFSFSAFNDLHEIEIAASAVITLCRG